MAEDGSFEELLDGVGFATAGEAGNVDDGNGAWGGGVADRVEREDFVARARSVVGGWGGECGENAVEPILHVGDEVLGVR